MTITGPDSHLSKQPDSGTVEVGETVQLSYVDQSRDSLNAENSVYEEITDGAETLKIGGREIHGRAYVASFNFKGSDQQKKVGGGTALWWMETAKKALLEVFDE